MKLILSGSLLVAFTGCEQERKAEAETAVAKAVVTTQMPEGAVSDEQLQRAAATAARIASTQPAVAAPVNPGALNRPKQGAQLEAPAGGTNQANPKNETARQ